MPSFSNLQELTKYHIERNVSKDSITSNSKFFIPKLGSESPRSNFSIPKINFSTKKTENEPDSLAKFAKLQLSSRPDSKSEDLTKKPFQIPNLFSKKEENKENSRKQFVIPTNVFSKSSGIVEEERSEDKAVDSFVIDLKSALEIEKIPLEKVQKTSEKPQTDSEFTPHFIDCDIVAAEPIKFEVSNIQLLTLLEIQTQFEQIKFQKFSPIGKIFKTKLKKRPIAKVPHNFVPKNVLKAFTFDSLSPDGMVLRQLNKKRPQNSSEN